MPTPRFRFSIKKLLVAMFALFAASAEAQTFTPELTPFTPPRIVVQAGQPGTQFQAAINHDPGFSSSIRVFFPSLPPGITISPSEQFLNPPYNAITFTISAAPTVPSGPYDIMAVFSSSETKSANLAIEVTGGASPAQSFTMNLAPRDHTVAQGETRTMSLTLTSVNGFAGNVTISSDHNASLLQLTPSTPFTLAVPANGQASQIISVRALPSAPPGATSFVVRAQSGTLQDSVLVGVNVTQATPPDFTFAATAPAGSVVAGQTATVTTSIAALNGFNAPVSLQVSAPNGTVTAAPLTVTAPYGATPLTLQVAANASGPTPVTITASGGGFQKTTTLTLDVQPAQVASFDLQVTPSDLAVAAGKSGSVTVRVVGSGGFTGSVDVTAPVVTAPGVVVTFTPQTFTMNAGESRTVGVAVAASSSTTSSPLPLEFRGTAGTLSDVAALRLAIAPAAGGNSPSIQAITPMAYTPQPAQEFIIIGRNFAPGAVAAIEQPSKGSIEVLSTRFISPTQLGATISVAPSTPTGGYLVTVRNPNGTSTAEPVRLPVVPQGALGGPAAVTRVAIEYPIRGQVIATGKGSVAAAHLASAGTGTISGRWRLRQSGNADDPGFFFDQFTVTVAGGYLVSTDRPCFDSAGRQKTTAHVCASIPSMHRGTYQLELLVDQPRLVTPASVPITIQTDSATELTIYRPSDNERISGHDPEFSWTLVPGAATYHVEFVRLEGDEVAGGAPIVIQSSRSTWKPDLRELRKRYGLTSGTWRWRVIAVYPGDLRGQTSGWSTIELSDMAFTSARLVAQVASTSIATLELQDASGEAPPSQATYTVAPNATLTAGKDQDPRGQFTVSSQGEFAKGPGTAKITGDLNYSASREPERVVQESRNWLIDAGTPIDRPGVGAQFGYTTPDFTSGAEFLVSGSAQTGVIGRARSRFGTFSYYQPVSTAIHGVMSGLDENLEIRSAALETPAGRPYTLRLIALEVEEDGDLETGITGTRLRTLGFYGRYDISPALSVVGEFARGRVSEQRGSESRDGAAMRAGISGMKGTFTYSANLRSIGANFVNPANRGLTPGGVSDRLAFDANVGKTVGRTALTFGVRRQQQGGSSESTMPESDETGFNVGAMTMFGGLALNIAANATANRGDADEALYLPKTHRDSRGVTTSLSRMFGRFSVAQTLGYQHSEDEVNPLGSQTMKSAGLTASGSLASNVMVNASLNGSRSEGAPVLGATNSWTASVQPNISITRLSLSLQPGASYSRSRNATLATDTRSEQYNVSIQWSPAFLGNLASAQVTSSWSRSGTSNDAGAFTQSYLGSITLRMSKQRGMPLFPTSAIPEVTAPAGAAPVTPAAR